MGPNLWPQVVRDDLLMAQRVLRGLVKARYAFPAGPIANEADDARPANSAEAGFAGGFRRLGRFRLERVLGRGGMGIVFLAYDPDLQRRVALKVPRPEALVSVDTHARFDREVLAAARLTHPNLISVHEVGAVGPVCFIASEYCDGPNLAQWIAVRTSLVPCEMAADILRKWPTALSMRTCKACCTVISNQATFCSSACALRDRSAHRIGRSSRNVIYTQGHRFRTCAHRRFD